MQEPILVICVLVSSSNSGRDIHSLMTIPDWLNASCVSISDERLCFAFSIVWKRENPRFSSISAINLSIGSASLLVRSRCFTNSRVFRSFRNVMRGHRHRSCIRWRGMGSHLSQSLYSISDPKYLMSLRYMIVESKLLPPTNTPSTPRISEERSVLST